MGFFDSIKNNLTGGGVKIAIRAPEQFDINATAIPVELTFTSNEPRTVKNIEYRLSKHAKDSGRRGNEAYDEGSFLKPYAQLNIEEPFQILPGVPVVRNEQLVLRIPDELKVNPLNPRQHDIQLSITAQVEGMVVAASALHVMAVPQSI